jgi:hypothetical protein
MLHAIQRLRDADGRRAMHDHVDAVERTRHHGLVAHVATDALDAGVEPRRPTVGVHLGVEIVEHAHGVAPRHEMIGKKRPDETGATGDENPLRHGGDPARLHVRWPEKQPGSASAARRCRACLRSGCAAC